MQSSRQGCRERTRAGDVGLHRRGTTQIELSLERWPSLEQDTDSRDRGLVGQ